MPSTTRNALRELTDAFTYVARIAKKNGHLRTMERCKGIREYAVQELLDELAVDLETKGD